MSRKQMWHVAGSVAAKTIDRAGAKLNAQPTGAVDRLSDRVVWTSISLIRPRGCALAQRHRGSYSYPSRSGHHVDRVRVPRARDHARRRQRAAGCVSSSNQSARSSSPSARSRHSLLLLHIVLPLGLIIITGWVSLGTKKKSTGYSL
jgi:hypothetical protein